MVAVVNRLTWNLSVQTDKLLESECTDKLLESQSAKVLIKRTSTLRTNYVSQHQEDLSTGISSTYSNIR
jgi:hypothetical protein